MGWIVFDGLVLLVNKSVVVPAGLVFCLCNVCSKHVLQLCFGSCLFVVFFGFLFLKLECFQCCSFFQQKHTRIFAGLDLVLILVHIFCIS